MGRRRRVGANKRKLRGKVSMLVQGGRGVLRRDTEDVCSSLVELLLLSHNGSERLRLVMLGIGKEVGGMGNGERGVMDRMPSLL
jgi:hypothetical protein